MNQKRFKKIIYIRPKVDYDWDGYVEWSVNKKKWYPISHIYIGTENEVPPPGQSFKTVPTSSIKKRLDNLWNKGLTVKILGDYRKEAKRLIVDDILGIEEK